MCPECSHRWEVTLSTDEWNAPLPSCAACDARETQQEFKPPAIGGSLRARAAAITEDIIANDFGVANYTPDNREGGVPKVRYKDQSAASVNASTWGGDIFRQAIEIGKQTRREIGADGLDILKRNLASGAQPDLIELSKKKSAKVW